jgi:hypothetical protein
VKGHKDPSLPELNTLKQALQRRISVPSSLLLPRTERGGNERCRAWRMEARGKSGCQRSRNKNPIQSPKPTRKGGAKEGERQAETVRERGTNES